MSKFVDLTGQIFGLLKVIQFVETGKLKAHWRVECECGKEKIILGASLKNGTTRTCGNKGIHAIKHGLAGTSFYTTWAAMLQRCTNEKHVSWKDYGGRGITVCEEWRKFENFYRDMWPRPEGLELDRRNNNLGYCKSNCRWVTKKEQQNNRRNS